MHEYEVKVTWEPGDEPYKRLGTLASDEKADITFATPPEFKQGIPGYWSPEHLFVGAASICMATTFLVVAQSSKLQFERFRIESVGILDDVEVDGKKQEQITEIHEKFYLQLTSPKDEEKAKKIVQKSRQVCLIANSMKSNVIAETIFE
ncbi:MAG TPA: OsmC family protein [Candidatus Lokiarchaeia archaeon]|nr:OsmC family protein [Candidatus Lokiarchaeia archaeon]